MKRVALRIILIVVPQLYEFIMMVLYCSLLLAVGVSKTYGMRDLSCEIAWTTQRLLVASILL